MPLLYESTDRTMRYHRAAAVRKLRKFGSSPGFWTGFGVATIVFVIAMPILAEPVAAFLRKKA